MNPLIRKHDLLFAFEVMDALSIRCDRMVYSQESLEREGSGEHLQRTFGTPSITNHTMDLILKELHPNYVALARGLVLEEQ